MFKFIQKTAEPGSAHGFISKQYYAQYLPLSTAKSGIFHQGLWSKFIFLMKCSFIMLVIQVTFAGVLVASTAKSQNINDVKVGLNLKGASVKESLIQLQTKSGFKFTLFNQLFNGENKKVTLATAQMSVKDALVNILSGTNLRYKLVNEFIVIEAKLVPLKPGRISGKVLDDKGEGLPGATIKVVETGGGTQTAVDGNYILNLPPGTYTLEISYMSFATQRITGVNVSEDKNTTLDIAMKPDAKGLKEVVITSSFKKASVEGLYARQKNNAAVSDGITAEQISRTPDNNTAQVLKRISGLQVSDGKYVVIRGLSDRYNNVLLNGAMLPSSEPNKRNFSFDMVPSAILDRIIVNKTATPDLTGEFTGGLVQIETKDIPTENFFQLTVGTGFNSQSTGKDMYGLDRGKNAWIGFASDIHKKPAGMTFGDYSLLEGQVNRLTTLPTDPKRQQMHQFLSTMPYNWTLKRYTAMPTQNYQMQLGQLIPFKNDSRLGVVAALTYRNEQDIENRSLYALYSNDFTGTNNKYTTTLGGSLNLGYQFGKHKFTFQNTYNRKFSDDMWKYTGTDGDNSNLRHDDYVNVTVINQLFQSQLGGEHTLGKRNIKIDWFASAGWVDRDQPYSRQVARLNGDDQSNYPPDYLTIPLDDNRLKNGNLFFSELKEKVYNWAANVQVPFQLLNLGQTFKMGYQGKYRTADFGANLFRMYEFRDGGESLSNLPYDQIFTTENFSKKLYLHVVNGEGRERKDASSAEGYDGLQRLNAFYAMLDLKPLKHLRLIGGMRGEKNDQNVYDFVWNTQAQASERKLTTNRQTDWLPSINAIYSLTEKLNFRAAWYKTVARPDLRELSSFSYWDYDLFESVTGSPLKTTRIQNADLRLEYYPTPGEVISISAFYKKFDNPIEMMIDATSGGNGYRYANLESALDKGLEVDFRKSFSFISPAPFWQNLYLTGNFTLLDASVTFLPTTSVDKDGNPVYPKRDRPLSGQSPYIVNGGLQYTGKSLGINLAYNRFGKRIVFASPDRSTDQYENPRDLLDLQISYKFLKEKRAEFKLNISDLLNQEQLFYINQFDLNNPFGFAGGLTSVERYPGVGTGFLPEHKDPKGTSYNKDYDTAARRYRFGTTYTLNFTYRF